VKLVTERPSSADPVTYPCPYCGATLEVVRIKPRSDALPERETFHCEYCNSVFVIDEMDP
jgi:transposase-like protein